MLIEQLIIVGLLLITILITLRVAYLTRDEQARQKALAKHKEKQGNIARELYAKVYNIRFIAALLAYDIWLALLVVSNVLEDQQGAASTVSYLVNGLAIIVGLIGLVLMTKTLRAR